MPFLSAFLAAATPAGLWYFGMRRWRPKAPLSYAMKMSLWPTVLLSALLGRPVSMILFGQVQEPLELLTPMILFVSLSILAAPVLLAVGYIVGRRRFVESPESINEAPVSPQHPSHTR